jgi:hypothetical protein
MSDDATTSALLTEQLTRPATRRQFLGRLAVAAGGATVLSIGGAQVALADPVTDFGSAAVGAERIGIAFYSNALGMPSPFGVPSDLAKGTLLNSAHHVYFTAALNQEDKHRAVLQSLGLDFPFSVFEFPAGTFQSAPAMLPSRLRPRQPTPLSRKPPPRSWESSASTVCSFET